MPFRWREALVVMSLHNSFERVLLQKNHLLAALHLVIECDGMSSCIKSCFTVCSRFSLFLANLRSPQNEKALEAGNWIWFVHFKDECIERSQSLVCAFKIITSSSCSIGKIWNIALGSCWMLRVDRPDGWHSFEEFLRLILVNESVTAGIVLVIGDHCFKLFLISVLCILVNFKIQMNCKGVHHLTSQTTQLAT